MAGSGALFRAGGAEDVADPTGWSFGIACPGVGACDARVTRHFESGILEARWSDDDFDEMKSGELPSRIPMSS
jgi:hypothetical protein